MSAGERWRNYALAAAAVVLLSGIAAACTTEPNVAPRRLDRGPEVRDLRGWVEDRDHVRIGRACLVLYRAQGTQQVRSLNAGPGGQFDFGKLAAGEYELVISDTHGIFHPLLLPVRVSMKPAVNRREVRIWLPTLSRRELGSNPYELQRR